MTALSIGLLFVVSLAYFKSLDREAAETRLLLYKRSLNDTLKRYQYFPFVLAQDPLTKETLNGAEILRLNLRLERFAEESELEAIYLMDADGLVLATSNFNQSPSFLGQNYASGPISPKRSRACGEIIFGIGATTGRPGYFRLRAGGRHQRKRAWRHGHQAGYQRAAANLGAGRGDGACLQCGRHRRAGVEPGLAVWRIEDLTR
jgi:C4-dicarboxylate-specific signal transduction histidine kinase